ncbi:hypothetical protein DIE08_34600 [Burkholderia sp. Bp9004]|nr:hypothetical protein DIE08_34600 [Burkholderia sp. Bp9004]
MRTPVRRAGRERRGMHPPDVAWYPAARKRVSVRTRAAGQGRTDERPPGSPDTSLGPGLRVE